jgi:hypothetical protein
MPKRLGRWLIFANGEAETVLGRFGEEYEEDIPGEWNGDIIWAPIPGIGPVVSFMFA